MAEIRLGRTGIVTEQNAFGALPIQRVSKEEAASLLQRAYDNGMTFFDTARGYSDSEEKIGYALSGVRDKINISTKIFISTALDNPVADFFDKLETSLKMLNTDYVDIVQFHNPGFCPKPDDGTGLYEAALKAKEQGKARFIGFTNHRLPVAHEAIESGLYDTLQFPFSYLATDKDIELVKACKEKDMGFIAMKALSGGLITNSAAAYAYLAQFDNVLPIWGIQRESELDEFISYFASPPTLNDDLQKVIDADRKDLSGNFCRGCGYCMPTCPAEIKISECARMSLFIRRAPSAPLFKEPWTSFMKKIEDCTQCGQCIEHCPYSLDTPTLLQNNYKDYLEQLSANAM